jgi:hypothetical protein
MVFQTEIIMVRTIQTMVVKIMVHILYILTIGSNNANNNGFN